jgi:3-phenylpropionate/trans-cinnamate dioxygenase ferredoxin reductase component
MAARLKSADILLIGGGVASARCARMLRRRGFTGSILLVGDEAAIPYNRPPLSKELLRGQASGDLAMVEPPDWYNRHRVELLTGVAVTELDVAGLRVRLGDGRTLRFDRCLLATGAEPRRLAAPGAHRIHTLRTLDDAGQIRSAAQAAGHGAPAVVIGGGFIGVEVAASLSALGLRVTVLEATSGLWGGALGGAISGWAQGRLKEVGVDVRFGALVERIGSSGPLVGGEALPAAVVVAGVGVTPRTALAEEAGLTVDDGIVLDASRTAGAGIFGAGDVARVPHPLAEGLAIRVEHWHAAREGGELAALGMLGEPVPPPRAPWVYSEFAGQMLDVVGWAPDRDEERVLGDPESGRFAVAYLRAGRVAQLALTNGFVPVEKARAFIEARLGASELSQLAAA